MPSFTDAEAFGNIMKEFVHPVMMHMHDADLINIMSTGVSLDEQLCGKYGTSVLETILATARANMMCYAVPSVETVRMFIDAEMNAQRTASTVEHCVLTQRIEHIEKVQSEYRMQHEVGSAHVQMLDDNVEHLEKQFIEVQDDVQDLLQVPEARTHAKGKQPMNSKQQNYRRQLMETAATPAMMTVTARQTTPQEVAYQAHQLC